MLTRLLGACAALAIAAPASAVTVTSSSDNVTVQEASPGLLSLDFALESLENGFAVANATVELEAADVGAPVTFNGLVDNFTGFSLDSIIIDLNGATFAELGDVVAAFSEETTILGGGDSIRIFFSGGEPFGAQLGDVFSEGLDDFAIDTSGLAAGDSFGLTLRATDVPAPAALGLLGLGMGALLLRQKRG